MSWAQVSNIDFLGTSPFQNLCCRKVRQFLPELDFLEVGKTEKVFVAHVPAAELELTLLFDSVILQSPAGELILESKHFKQPDDLVSRLIAELSNSM